MKKTKNSDVLQLLGKFQDIITNKPSNEKMLEEVRMMNFKIRPLQGDVTILNLRDKELIEALWSLGKLDEFFKREYPKLPSKSRPLAFKIYEDLTHKFQEKFSRINLRHEKMSDLSPVLEMEIIKDRLLKKPN